MGEGSSMCQGTYRSQRTTFWELVLSSHPVEAESVSNWLVYKLAGDSSVSASHPRSTGIRDVDSCVWLFTWGPEASSGQALHGKFFFTC